jgi:hypothetical protein
MRKEMNQKYFVSCLLSRVLDLLDVLAKHDIAPIASYTDAGFVITEIECTEQQAFEVCSAGFHVAEQ